MIEEQQNFKRSYFICYEDLPDKEYQQKIKNILDLNDKVNFNFNISSKEVDRNFFDNELLLKADKIYEKLKSIS